MNALTRAIKRNPLLYRNARRLSYKLRGYPEQEMELLRYLVDPRRIAIDVGAHCGAYTGELLKLCPTVIAVEAIPDLATLVGRLYPGARIVAAAASDKTGQAELRIPERGTGLSTLAGENSLGELASVSLTVPTVTLDSLTSDAVGFIKIDVEGHELRVLEGATSILARDRPAILVEAEERHRSNAVRSLCDLMEPWGYRGFFLDDGLLRAVDGFDPARDQGITAEEALMLERGEFHGRYINNFIFVA